MPERARVIVPLLAMVLSVVFAAGPAGAQDAETRSEAATTLEYLSQLERLLGAIDDARADAVAGIERIDTWLAQDDVVVFGQRSGDPEAVPIAELGRTVLVASVVSRLGLSRRHAGLLALVDDVLFEGGTVEVLAREAGPDQRQLIAERLGQLVRRSDQSLERWKEELEQELEDYAELEALIEAELVELASEVPTDSSAAGGATAMIDADEGVTVEDAVDIGGPFETCTWRTGWPVLDAYIPEMRIYAWTITNLGPGLGPNQFGYSVAWELDDGRGDPERMFDGQEDEIDQVLTDGVGEVIFRGGASGFCSFVESICPGYRPPPCATVLGP